MTEDNNNIYKIVWIDNYGHIIISIGFLRGDMEKELILSSTQGIRGDLDKIKIKKSTIIEMIKMKETNKEWEKMYDKLLMLSVDELLQIAEEIGVKFADKNFMDKEELSAKDQIIPLLDEAPSSELEKAYKKIIENK